MRSTTEVKTRSSMDSGRQSPRSTRLFELLGNLPAETAARHGVSALLGDVTEDPQVRLDAQSTVARGLRTKQLTLAVLDALRQAGVVPVLLKGYGLAVRLYPEQPLARPSTDVDVLLSPEELQRSRPALARLGLVEVPDPAQHGHHVAFSGPRGLVEAHFKLLSAMGGGEFDEAALRQRRVTGTLEGREVYYLAPDDEFIYLATHAANHGFLRLGWLVDLERYLAWAPLDFELMARRARAAGFHTAVAQSLALLQSLLGVALPGQAQVSFRLSPWRGFLGARLFSAARVRSASWSDHRLGSFLLRLLLVDTPAHGLRHLLEGAERYYRRTRAGS